MRIWVDGCFDFFHHGHAGALNQARALGDALYVGVHSDEEILENKGPVVMHMDERELAVTSCRWTTKEVSDAPYVTDPDFMLAHGCEYVAHGDDITTDANGNDCYQKLKDAHRFLEFKRTPNISTTDLIARMLSNSTEHHKDADYAFLKSDEAQRRFSMYATASDAKSPYAGVWYYNKPNFEYFVMPKWSTTASHIVYAEGVFDLFHCGHIEFLKGVKEKSGPDSIVIVGLASDGDANAQLGGANPIMNIFERALCVLQCKYVDGVVLNVTRERSRDVSAYLQQLEKTVNLPLRKIAYGFKERNDDKLYAYAKKENLLLQIPKGKFSNLKTSTIVARVLDNRAQYEERQRKKSAKAQHEVELKHKENVVN